MAFVQHAHRRHKTDGALFVPQLARNYPHARGFRDDFHKPSFSNAENTKSASWLTDAPPDKPRFDRYACPEKTFGDKPVLTFRFDIRIFPAELSLLKTTHRKACFRLL
jgi:hypothetical protein